MNTNVSSITIKLVWGSRAADKSGRGVVRARQSKSKFRERWGGRDLEIGENLDGSRQRVIPSKEKLY